MGTEVYGIGAAQSPDNVGETILVDNMDRSQCRILSDEHADEEGNLPMFRIIGTITKTKVIHNENECEDQYQLKCWKHASVPFVYVEGLIADDSEHPDAKAAAALLKFCQKPEIPLKIGLSVEGGTIERSGHDKKVLARTVSTGFAMTVKPCNHKCALFVKNDLMKSDRKIVPPARYFEALKKSQAKTSVFENKNLMLLFYMEKLKKSLVDYFGAFTDLKCHHCGKAVRLFKSTQNMPNGCSKCGNSYSLSDIWKALNK